MVLKKLPSLYYLDGRVYKYINIIGSDDRGERENGNHGGIG